METSAITAATHLPYASEHGANASIQYGDCTCGWSGPGRRDFERVKSDIASHLGAVAHGAGEARIVPRGILVNQGATVARAWYRGWDGANTADAPQTDTDDHTADHAVEEIVVTRGLVVIGCTCGWVHDEPRGFDTRAARARARKMFTAHKKGN